jgi:hypothetical protein
VAAQMVVVVEQGSVGARGWGGGRREDLGAFYRELEAVRGGKYLPGGGARQWRWCLGAGRIPDRRRGDLSSRMTGRLGQGGR